MNRLIKITRQGKVIGLIVGLLALGALVFLGVFATFNELKASNISRQNQAELKYGTKTPAISKNEELIKFAEGFLPAPVEGTLKEENELYVYKRPSTQTQQPPDISQKDKPKEITNDTLGFEAIFSKNKARVWLSRSDSAFGMGMEALMTSFYSYLKNGRVIYTTRGATIVYTPLDNGIREDILVANAKDLARLPLLWLLELDSHLEARTEPDGAIGIYGPEQYLWGNIQIGDAKSAELIEKARQNAAKNTLLYQIPLAVVREANGKEHKEMVSYKLEGKKLALGIKGYKDLLYPISIDPNITITDKADFTYPGNDEGMISWSTSQITRATAAGGVVSWTATTSFATARWLQGSVAYNGYLYVIGGQQGLSGAVFSDVQYASISSNGTLGSWTPTTSLPTATSDLVSVAYNSYLYITGGYWTASSVGGGLSDVQYAVINADGTLGSWTPTTSFTTARWRHTSVAYNGYLYVTGGYWTVGGVGGTLSDVQYASINSNGTLGSWATTTSFTTARCAHTSVAYNGYLYIIGGDTTSGAVSITDVQCAPINANGTLGSWTTTHSLNAVRDYHTSAVYNGYLYVIGGLSPGSSLTSSVQYASISNTLTNNDGTVGTWSSTTYPTTRAAHSSAAYNGYLYVMGGYNGSNVISSVQYASISSNGTLGSWTTTQSFNVVRNYHTSAAYNGYLYVIGGATSASTPITSQLSSVEYASISSNGTLGSWTLTTSLTLGTIWHSSVAYNGYLYVLGGYTSNSNVTSNVQYASISSNGTLGSWTPANSFITPRICHSSVAYNGYLYVMGGSLYSSVEYVSISSIDGSLGTWSITNSFNTARCLYNSVAYNGYLYIIGGDTVNYYGSSPTSSVEYASISSNGTLGSWTSTTSLTTATSKYGSAAYNGYLYVIRGTGGGVQYVALRTPAQKGYYSRLIDLGSASAELHSVVVNWTTANKGTVRLQYRYTPYGSVNFTTEGSINEVTRGSTVNLSDVLGRYLWLRLTLDDTYAALISPTATNQRDVTDITVSYDSAAPTQPSNLSITSPPTIQQRHDLSWTDNSDSEEGFEIGRSTNSGWTDNYFSWTVIPSTLTAPQTVTATDTYSLTHNTAYYYRVCAYNTDSWTTVSSAWTEATTDNPKYTLAANANVSWTSNPGTISNGVNDFLLDGTTTPPTITWSNDATFGSGGVDHYHYLWTTAASYSVTGTENEWTTGTLSWSVTDTNTYYLYAKAYNGDGVAATSNATYDSVAYRIALKLTTPDGGQNWSVGKGSTIQWTKNSSLSENVNILYSRDGSSWTADDSACWTIATNQSGTSYLWTPIGDQISSGLGTAKIRIQGDSHPSLQDTSTTGFTVRGIQLILPDGGETWEEGSQHHKITWTSLDLTLTNTLKIEYSTDSGTTWTTAKDQNDSNLDAVALSEGTTGKVWKIPADLTNGSSILTNCKIKISYNLDTDISDSSDVVFSVEPYRMTLTAPTSPFTYMVNNNYPTGVTWTTKYFSDTWTFILDYSRDSGNNWKDMVNGTTGQSTTVGVGLGNLSRSGTSPDYSWAYSWTIPATETAATGTVKVRVRHQLSADGNTSTWTLTSGLGSFSLQNVSVTSPGDAEANLNYRWIRGDAETIFWSTEGLASQNWTIECHYYYGDPLVEYTKTIFTDNKTYDTFDGTYYNYSWSWTVANDSAAQTWTQNSDNAWIKVFDAANSSVTGRGPASEEAYFKIVAVPTISIAEPTSSDAWYVNTGNDSIRWNFGSPWGDVNNKTVTLQYSTDYPSYATWTTIVDNASNPTEGTSATTYSWTILYSVPVSNNAKMKIWDNGRTATTDTTSWTFRLLEPSISVTSPTLDEERFAGVQYTIAWTSTPGVGGTSLTPSGDKDKITITYNIPADGINWSPITAAAAQHQDWTTPGGNYAWTIDDTALDGVTDTVSLKLVDNSRTATWTTKQFKIVAPKIYLQTPVGGETWRVGKQYNIEWTSTVGVSSSVKLEYYNSGTSTWTIVDNPTGGNVTHTAGGTTNSYGWTIPNIAPDETGFTQCKIKITDNNRTQTWTASTAATLFSISRPDFPISAPAAGVTWRKGQTQTITWTNEGTISSNSANLDVYYSYDGGTSWTTIDDQGTYSGSPPSSFTWTIGTGTKPTVSTSAGAKIKIQDNVTPSGKGETTWTFILAKPQLTYNNTTVSGATWTLGTNHTLQWTTEGQITTVRIQYRPDSGSSWTTIDETTGNNTSATGDYTSYSKTYSWTIPNNDTYLSNGQGQIKLTSLVPNDPLINSTSTAFTVAVPLFTNIQVTQPDYNPDAFYVGDTTDISWTWVGSLTASGIKVSYSTDSPSYSTWWTCSGAEGLANTTTSFNWTIPSNAVSSNATKIKVEDLGRSASIGISSTFTVSAQPTLTITPLSGQDSGNWRVGKPYTITWTGSAGINTDSVSIDWSTADYSSEWSSIATGRPTSSTWTWTVSQAALDVDHTSVLGQIKISDATRAASGTLVDVWTVANFNAVNPVITISAPTSSTYWTYAGANQNITWSTDGGVSYVKIYYDPPGSGTWTLLNTSANWSVANTSNGTTNYSWTIPDSIGSNQIRIDDTTRWTTTTTTSSNFSIVGGVTLITPSLSDIVLVATDPYTVTWTHTGTFSPVRLQFYDSNNSAWYDMSHTWSVSGNYTEVPNTDSYSWTLPSISSTISNAKVRVYDPYYDSRVIDESNNTFEVGPEPTLTITAPTGTPSWTVGTGGHTISWTASSNVHDDITIEWSAAGVSWTTIAENKLRGYPTAASYSWTVPQAALAAASSSGTLQLRVRDASRAATQMTNAPAVNIYPPTITVGTIPSVLTVGNTQAITWTNIGQVGDNNGGNVRLVYSTGTDFKDPLDGDTYVSGNTNTYVTVAASAGTYTWTVRDDATSGSTCVFKVIDDTRPTIASGTSNNFRILHGAITVTQPIGAETWYVEEATHPVTWTYLGNIGNVKLEYATDGATWTVISGASSLSPSLGGTAWTSSAPNTAGNGTYTWPAIPNNISDTVKVRISAVDTAIDTSGTSANNFYIKGSFTTPSPPATNAVWTINTGNAITWTSTGTIAKVKLYYTTNGDQGSPTWTIMDATSNWSIANNGPGQPTSYTWTIPTTLTPTTTSTAKVKVVSASDANVSKESGLFKIIGSFTAPNPPASGVSWTLGQAKTITWTSTGTIAKVKLYYTTNGDQGSPTWTIMDATSNWSVTNTPNLATNYTWTIPTALTPTSSATARVKVTDANDSDNVSNQSALFKLVGDFTAPNPPASGVSWTIGTAWAITWTTTGDISKVKLYYTTNAGSPTWTLLDTSTGWSITNGANGSSATWTWTVADDISSQARIKVEDASDTDTSKQSATFNIKGTLDLKAPNGGEYWTISTQHNVTWSVTAGSASITQVKLQYSTDGGTNWKSMDKVANEATTVDTSGSSGSYAWTIPDDYTSSLSAKVRIFEATGAAINPEVLALSNVDSSDSYFRIDKPGYTFLQPGSQNSWTGDNALTQDHNYSIIWTTTGMYSNNVKLLYSNTDDFTTNYWTITATTGNTGSYSWTPDQTGLNMRIKIEEISSTHTAGSAISNVFEIYPEPSITVDTPVVTWIAGKNYPIKWTAVGLVRNLTIKYTDTDASTTWWTIATAQPNTDAAGVSGGYYSYSWTLPAFYNETVHPNLFENTTYAKIKITDATAGTTDTSNNFTIGIPTMTLSQPNGSEYWAVGDTAQIKWTYQGSIQGPLTLQYDTSASSTFGAPGVSDISTSVSKTGGTSGDGTYAYNWTIPSVTASSSVRLKVFDTPRENSYDVSDAVLNFLTAPEGTVTLPTASSHWYVGDTWTISWTIHGIIGKNSAGADNLVIQYSDDNFTTNKWTIATGVSRGTTQISGNEYSGNYSNSSSPYTWTIPNDAHTSNTMKVRVYDPDRSIYWTSAAFPLTGGFLFSSPTTSSTWTAATSNNNIIWSNQGAHDSVNLQYATSTDGLTYGSWTTIQNSIVNSASGAGTIYNSSTGVSTYAWTVIPDPASSSYPASADPNSGNGYYYYYVKLKLTDANDSTIVKESDPFKITYYQIKFAITNEYNNIVSGAMNFRDTVWSIANTTATVEAGGTTYQHKYPYGTYTTLLNGGTGTDYGSDQISSWAADSNKTISKKIYSNTYLATEWNVQSNFFYDEDNDILKVNTWLERKGSLISNDENLGLGGDSYVKIYSSASPDAVLWTLTDSTADTTGNFWFTWTTTGLTSGVTYFARCGIYFSNELHESGATFTVSVSQKLKEITDLINTTTSAIQATTATISSQTTALKTAVGEKTAALTDVITATGRVLTAAETTIPGQITSAQTAIVDHLASEIEPQVQSGILNRDNVVKQGETVTIRYRGVASGLSPTITVYDPSNTKRVDGVTMTEIGTSGIYEYDLPFNSSWGVGDYTILTSESTKGTLDALIMTAQQSSMEDVYGQVSAILGTTSSMTDLNSTINTLDSQLSTIITAITSLVQPGGEVGQGISKTVEQSLDPIISALKKVAADMKGIGGTEGYNLDDLYQISDKHSKDIKYLSNKTLELKKLLEIIRQLAEKKFEEPVIKTWYESGSVILRILVINPSKTQVRTIPFKYNLPREVKPNHIMDKGDLELIYDPQQGAYVVSKDLELKPGESKRLSVEIEDIWNIDERETRSLENQSKKFLAILKDSSFYERAQFLADKIDKDLKDILERQKATATVNPEEHISVYRENTRTLELVKQDILEMERLSTQVGRISPISTWWMIILIVLFLGLLSLAFFFIWHKKLGEVIPEEEATKKESSGRTIEAESRQAKEEKKIDIEDIKKRLNEPGEPKA